MKKLVFSLLLAAGHVHATEGTFTVHEWGTFTSVQGSNGQALGGMNHEEEALPSFVVGRDVFHEPFHKHCRITKGMPICDDQVIGPVIHAADVTQKMETPVIYFHSDRQRDVSVNVDFPKGIISQYYPQPVSFLPYIGQVASLTGGNAAFYVNVGMSPLALPQVAPTSVYAPARQVNANFISSGSENEKFIFYRGLGNFQTEVNVTSYAGGIAIGNSAGNYVPAVFLIDVAGDGSGSVRRLGALQGRSSHYLNNVELPAFRAAKLAQADFLAKASSLLNESLRQTGLNRDEAEAMTNTWKNSYFRNPGLRVLYILSRAETDALLPLTVYPAPQELNRALVGRIEVILDTEETAMLANLQKDMLYPSMLGRFAEPKLRRLLQLTQDAALSDKIRAMIAKLQ